METNQESSAVGLGVDDLTVWLDRVLFQPADPIVVALKGGWGEGKTYFWKRSIAPNRPNGTVVYASVFGAEAIQDVRDRVVAARLATLAANMSVDADRSTGVIARISRTWASFRRSLPEITETVGLPSKFITRVLEDQLLSPGTVICLDDIERASETLGADALLGYITELRDERRLKVVLIFNDDKVGNVGDSFRLYREKAIDREVVFRPSLDEVLQLAFGRIPEIAGNRDRLANLKHWCRVLDLRNVRLLTKCRHYYEEVRISLPTEPDAAFVDRVLASLLLFVWIRFTRRETELPSFNSLTDHSELFQLMQSDPEKDGTKISPEQQAGKLLQSYGYRFTDELDRVLMHLVQTDTLDVNRVLEEYRSHAAETTRGILDGKLRTVWTQRFHGTLEDNETEFCDELVSATREYLPSISIPALDGSLSMLSRLDRAEAADALLHQFKELRRDAILNFDRGQLFERIKHSPLEAILSEAEGVAATDTRSIHEVVRSALESDFTSRRDRERLAQFSAEDFERYFLSTEQEGLTSQIRKLGNAANRYVNPDGFDIQIQVKVRAAATSIANGSRLNRLRMEAMGLVGGEVEKMTDSKGRE